MPFQEDTKPALFKGVMVSSTFIDLKPHRKELMKALTKEELFPIGMEYHVPIPGEDVISSSLRKVRRASAYIGLVSHRYGQVIDCPERNPQSYSVSRLEFEEAQRLGKPTLVFVMGDDHLLTKDDVETDSEKIKKLKEYRERVKHGRIYAVFDNLDDFKTQAIHSVARLRQWLDEQDFSAERNRDHLTSTSTPPKREQSGTPEPPAFYSEPPYIGSQPLIGRVAELERISEWALPSDAHTVLLFEAIGGTGKSLLTWEWATRHSTEIRNDWAGRMWYSFYEKGAIMADFCHRALAYITGQPLEELRKKKTKELGDELLRQLRTQPWLIILDGLERVLVAYHRFDAAQVADDQVDETKDQIVQRDTCAAIRPEDDELLRALTAASPSKLLITTRLTPRVLLNPGGGPLSNVCRVPLLGLLPTDAEQLLRSCGVEGDSQRIQNYLKSHCDCHPLVTGVLAGLINDYLPDRGNFDTWESDIQAGGQLNLADLNLVQKRNHILRSALDALPEKSRQLLSTLALLSEAVDVSTIRALNPHLPDIEKIQEPQNPEDQWWLEEAVGDEKESQRLQYLERRREYDQAKGAWEDAMTSTTPQLAQTVRDLEHRGLLQYDRQLKRYDLHPVVRGFASGGLKQDEKESYGRRVVDYFSQQAPLSYRDAETLDDLSCGLHIVRTLLLMGEYQQAADAFVGNLCNPLLFNLEAHAELLTVARPFFRKGWGTLPDKTTSYQAMHMAGDAAMALTATGELDASLLADGAVIRQALLDRSWEEIKKPLVGIANVLLRRNRLAKVEQCVLLEIELCSLLKSDIYNAQSDYFTHLTTVGRFSEAESLCQELKAKQYLEYHSGSLLEQYARLQFYQGRLQEEQIVQAEEVAKKGKNRPTIRRLHELRGDWYLDQNEWELAAASYHEAVLMGRESRKKMSTAETLFHLAKFKLGELPDARSVAEQMEQTKASDWALAKLWIAIGDHERAKKHALAAYESSWADGEPYVFRHALTRAKALLEQIGEKTPDLPHYDPDKQEDFPWERELRAALAELRAEKKARDD